MKLCLILLLAVVFVCIEASRFKPVKKSQYRNILRRYGPRRRTYQFRPNNWNRIPDRQLWNLRKLGGRPGYKTPRYSRMKLDGVNARVIPLQVGKQAIKMWEKAEYDIDYNRRPRMCPRNYIAVCFRSPYIEILGRPSRKCLTMCKDKPCIKPCVCECKPKYKVKLSKHSIQSLLIPVDKRQLIPSCNKHQIVKCTAQIYGEATDHLCAHGCGEGVCPLTCNCQCFAHRSKGHDLVSSGINMNLFDNSVKVTSQLNNVIAAGTEPRVDAGNSIRNLGNGVFMEGPGLGFNNFGGIGNVGNDMGIRGQNVAVTDLFLNDNNAGNDLLIGPGNGGGNVVFAGESNAGSALVLGHSNNGGNEFDFGGPAVAAAGTGRNGGLIFTEGDKIIGGIQNNVGGQGRRLIFGGRDGVLLDNDLGRPNIITDNLNTDIVPAPIALVSPIEPPMSSFIPQDTSMPVPLQGIETETVQVKIDVQTPNEPGGGVPNVGNTGSPNFNNVVDGSHSTGGFPVDNFLNGASPSGGSNGQHNFGIGKDIGHKGQFQNMPRTISNRESNFIGSKSSVAGEMGASLLGSKNSVAGDMGPTFSNQVSSSGNAKDNNLKLRIPGSKKEGGAINLDLSGILSSIPGMEGLTGMGNGGNILDMGAGTANGDIGTGGALTGIQNGGGTKETGGIGMGQSGGFIENGNGGATQGMGNSGGVIGKGTGSSIVVGKGTGNSNKGTGVSNIGGMDFASLNALISGNSASNGGLDMFGEMPFNPFGISAGRSDVNPLSALGTEMSPFGELNFGSPTAGGNSLQKNNNNQMNTLISQLINSGGGTGKPEPEDQCFKGTVLSCTVTPEWTNTPGVLQWCNTNCPKGVCNRERCKCTCLTQEQLLIPGII